MVSSLQQREYVVDANVLFSFLISGRESYLTFLTDNKIFTPDFALAEIQIYQNVIIQRSKLPLEQFRAYALDLFSRITVVPNLLVTTQYYYQAFTLCRDIDPKDISYVALSLQLGAMLLTRDKPLAIGLRAKGFANVILLDELFATADETDSTNQPE